MAKCGEKNVFNDISKCGNLPLDSAFKNYNMKGGAHVVDGNDDRVQVAAKSVLNEMATNGVDFINKVGGNDIIASVKSLTGGGRRCRRAKKQKGGRESNGYYLGVGTNNIGGRAEVVPYSTCNSPVFNTSCRDLRGGKKHRSGSKNKRSRTRNRRRSRTRRKRSHSRSRNRNRIRRSKSRSRNRRRIKRSGSRSKSRSRSRSNRKSRSNNRRHKNRRGGGGIDPYNLSGLPSNFSPDMTTRQFGCKAPYWQPKCV